MENGTIGRYGRRRATGTLDKIIAVRICFIIVGYMTLAMTLPLAVQSVLAASPASVPDATVHLATVVHGDARSGRLVRTVVVDPTVVEPVSIEARPVDADAHTTDSSDTAASSSVPAPSLHELAQSIAREHGVEDSLVHSVILAESNYNPRAVSPKGALGVMQLIPETARRFGVGNAFDPKQNIEGGVRYLKFLLDYYKGNYPKAIAAYNAGEGAVDRYNGIPPYAETRAYVYRVARNLKVARAERAKQILLDATAKPAPAAAAKSEIAEIHKPVKAALGVDGRVYYGNP